MEMNLFQPHFFLYYNNVNGELLLTPLFFITVSEEELRRLGKRFKKLDIDKNGTISIEEFMSLPELQQNPLVRRVIDLFDTDRNGEIDFKGTFSF